MGGNICGGGEGCTLAAMTRRANADSDIRPVSDFGGDAAGLIEHVKTSGRPLVLTEQGHSAAVVLDVADYERMVEEIELLSDVRTAVRQIDAGEGVSNADAQAELRTRFSR